jgi:hypothetical protein
MRIASGLIARQAGLHFSQQRRRGILIGKHRPLDAPCDANLRVVPADAELAFAVITIRR